MSILCTASVLLADVSDRHSHPDGDCEMNIGLNMLGLCGPMIRGLDVSP